MATPRSEAAKQLQEQIERTDSHELAGVCKRA